MTFWKTTFAVMLGILLASFVSTALIGLALATYVTRHSMMGGFL